MLALQRFLQALWVDADLDSGAFLLGAVSKSAVPLTGDRGSESISLQRGVNNEPVRRRGESYKTRRFGHPERSAQNRLFDRSTSGQSAPSCKSQDEHATWRCSI